MSRRGNDPESASSLHTALQGPPLPPAEGRDVAAARLDSSRRPPHVGRAVRSSTVQIPYPVGALALGRARRHYPAGLVGDPRAWVKSGATSAYSFTPSAPSAGQRTPT